MGKAEVYALLAARGVRYEVTEHQAVYTVAEAATLELPHPEAGAKNLFVRDDKKRAYYIITVRDDTTVDLKEFRRRHGTRPLSFASADDLRRILDLEPGAVTPLGVLNDADRRVEVFLDRAFEEVGLVGVHPNDNTATVWLAPGDLVAVLRAHGTTVHVVDM